MMTDGAKLIRDGVWVMAGRGVSMVSGLLAMVLIARLLDKDEMGFYFLCVSLVTILSVASQFGLNLAVVRLIAEMLGKRREAHAASVVRLSIRFVLVAAVIISILSVIFMVVHPPDAVTRLQASWLVFAMLVAWFVFMTMQGLIAECLRGYHAVRDATIYGVMLSSLLSLAGLAGIWALSDGSSLEVILGVFVVAVGISVIVGAGRLRSRMHPDERPGGIDLGGLLSLAWPMWATNLTLLVLTQADIWIVGSFLEITDVALYGAATRLAVLVSFSLVIVNAVIAPVISDLYHREERGLLERRLRTGAGLAAVPAVLTVLVFYLFGRELLALVYGDGYTDAYLLLLVLSVGQLFNVVTGSSGMVLLMTGHQRTMMKISLFTVTLAIVASIYAAIYVGSIGVAAVFSAALVVQNVLMLHYLGKYTGLSTFMSFR
jgi:O-antigen/teichoic acid export membrane protein